MMHAVVEQPVNPYLEQFPYLDHLLGAWFHQDFELEGDVEQIISKFVAVTRSEEVWAVIADIRRFVAYRHNDSEDAFLRLFPGAVLPSGWGLTTIEWLQWIDRLLVAALRTST